MSRRGELVCDGCGTTAPEKGASNTMPPLWGKLSRYVHNPNGESGESFDLCPSCFVRVRDAVKEKTKAPS